MRESGVHGDYAHLVGMGVLPYVKCRVDTPAEVEYILHGGILT